jgi:hypothetical protein
MTQRHLITAHRIGLVLILLGVLNFSAFFIHALVLGGDAVNGKYDNGHFFVKSHGKYTEVTESQFDNSRRHLHSMIATQVGAVFGALLLWLGPSSATWRDPPEHASYWKAAGIACGLSMIVGSRFMPRWLVWVLMLGLVTAIAGGFVEWFMREWNAETRYANANSNSQS